MKLDDTYDQAMLRIEDQTRQQIKRAEQVLSWVTLAERPLTVKEMQCALAVASGDTFLDEDGLPDEDMMVSACAGLVVIDQQKSIIRLVHYTTQDYLERTLEARYPRAQRNICETCITYLSFEIFEDGPCREGRNDKNLEARIKKNILLAYAAQNWGIHARKASDHETTIDELIHGFLRQRAKLSSSYQIVDHSQRRPGLTLAWAAPKDVTALSVASFFALERAVVTLLRKGHNVNSSDSHGRSALHVAAEMGHETIVQLLLENGADFEAKCIDGKTALHWAASTGREHSVRILLERGFDPTCDGVGAMSMTCEAANRGHTRVVQMLLLHMKDLKSKSDFTFAALERATLGGQGALVKMILEEHANPEEKHRCAAAVLHIAARGNDASVLKLLLEYAHGFEFNVEDIQKALWSAVMEGRVFAIRLLLDAGANPNQRPKNPQSPNVYQDLIVQYLTTKCGWGYYFGGFEVVKMLVEAGADIESKNSMGWTPLLLAAKTGNTELLCFLLELGANAAVEEQETGRRALQWAAIAGDLEAVQLLLQQRCETGTDIAKWSILAQLFQAVRKDAGTALPQFLRDLNSLDPTECHVLKLWHLVVEKGQESASEALLNMGISLEAIDNHGNTALNLAAGNGHEGIVQLLLSKGANVDAESDQDFYGGTPLSQAAKGVHAGVVRVLLDAGAKVETEHQRKTGTTPLNMVAPHFFGADLETIIQLLLERGANTEIASTDHHYKGCTPLMMARRSYHSNTFRLLLNKGANMEAKDKKGKTALYHAAENGSIDTVRLLLERGADQNSVDLATIGTEYFECEEDYDECIRLIRDAQWEKNAKSDITPDAETQDTEVETEKTDVVGKQNTPIVA